MSLDTEMGDYPVSNISRLSVDLFSIIETFLDVVDIKNARLAGRELHFFLSPYLIQSVTFAPHKSCLDLMDLISKDPILSHNVKTLRFDTSTFRLPMVIDDLDKWEFHSSKDGHPLELIYSTDLATHVLSLEAYIDYVAEQESINKNLEKALCRVLQTFPKISTLIITNNFTEKDDVSFRYALQRKSISRKWIRSSQLLALFNAISKSACDITRIDVEGHWVQKRYPDNSYFGAEPNTPGSIRFCFPDLESARYWKEKKPFIPSDAFNLTPDQLSISQGIFQNLTHLDLCVATAVPMNKLLSQPPPKAYWFDLPKILQSLNNIVHLSLDLKIHREIDEENIYFYYHDDIAEIFGRSPPPTFPRLKSLKIAQFRSSTRMILSLLQKNRTIENLSLRYFIRVLDPGANPYTPYFPAVEWGRGLDIMRDMKLKRLDFFGIEGFGRNFERFGDENESLKLARIHDYILQYVDSSGRFSPYLKIRKAVNL